MDLKECFEVLSEDEIRQTLSKMFHSVLTVNGTSGDPLGVVVNGAFVRPNRSINDPVIEHLADTAFDIFKTAIENDAQDDWATVWKEQIYDYIIPDDKSSLDTTVKDMINELRRSRACRIANDIVERLEIDLDESAHILDFGVGSGVIAKELLCKLPNATLTGVDIHDYVIPSLKEDPVYKDRFKLVGSLEDVEKNSCDYGLACWMFHHTPFQQHAKYRDGLVDVMKLGSQFYAMETVQDYQPFIYGNVLLSHLGDFNDSEKQHELLKEAKALEARAFFLDYGSSNGLTPDSPYTGTNIEWHAGVSRWEEFWDQPELGVKLVSTENIPAKADEFWEKSFYAQAEFSGKEQ